MAFSFDKEALFEQARAVYERYPTEVGPMERELDRRLAETPDASSLRKKAWVYEVAAQGAELRLFPASPFFAEIDTGRERNSVTATFPPQPGLGCWLIRQYPDFLREYEAWERRYSDIQLLRGSSFTDTAHHYANCETVLREGFGGIQARARRRLARAEAERDAHGVDFLHSVIDICESVFAISRRFARLAEQMLEKETDPAAAENLARVASTAARVPQSPPETFYEALETIWFTREICNALEGLGFAVIGHIDRLLQPYYERDLREGRITQQEAQELISCFLAQTDARWDLGADLPGGTNADVIIGGCDAEGTLVFNDVTRMVLNAYLQHRFANPKLQARCHPNHPAEYYELLSRVAGAGLNVLSIFNDEVIIAANAKRGKAIEDCRLYQAGGCQELVVDREVNCRAYVYLNLPKMLAPSLFPEEWEAVYAPEQLRFAPAWRAESFEEFYRLFLANLRLQTEALARRYSAFGQTWRVIDPAPLFSATLPDCIESARDVSEGGARYNTDCFAAVGFGTLADSLYGIRDAVYTRKTVTMEALRAALAADFSGEEALRRFLQNQVPKFGRETEANTFGSRVMTDIAFCLGGMPNGRGGVYEASLFAFYAYEWFKDKTGSTPDGRRAGAALSRGANPGESTENIDVATLLDAQRYLDYTNYPGGCVTYMDLPLMKTQPQYTMYASVIQQFLQNGGCIMDFNVVDRLALEEARRDPESHRNIVVRVCGYSAYFHSLSEEMQDEVIARLQR